MSRRKLKGGGVELVVVAFALFLALGIILLNQVLLMSGIVVSKRAIDSNMYIDDRGSELLGLFRSGENDVVAMYSLGALAADNHNDYVKDYIERIDDRIQKMGVKHELIIFGESLAYYLGKETKTEKPVYTEVAAQTCGLNAPISDNIVLKWPSSGKKVTSGFGYRRLADKCDCHGGIDVGGENLDVYAAADGIVVDIYPDPDKGQTHCKQVGNCLKIKKNDKGYSDCRCNHGYGNSIVIDHVFNGKKYRTYYYHLKAVDSKLRVGGSVKAGDIIAKSGNTGYSSGAHLHFELRGRSFSADKDSINPCNLFDTSDWTGDCIHDFPDECKTFRVYGTYIPLPGARAGNVNTGGSLRAW